MFNAMNRPLRPTMCCSHLMRTTIVPTNDVWEFHILKLPDYSLLAHYVLSECLKSLVEYIRDCSAQASSRVESTTAK